VLKKHGIQHRNGLLPVGVVLDEGDPWCENEVFWAMQGIRRPSVPRLPVRVKVVDEIDEGRC